jgi:hypothetical protein
MVREKEEKFVKKSYNSEIFQISKVSKYTQKKLSVIFTLAA